MNRRTTGMALFALLLAGCANETKKAAPMPRKEKHVAVVVLKTSKGDVKLELDKDAAPETVANFLEYAKAGHYDGTIFHRVISNFMIQGGGFDAQMHQKPAPRTVRNEAANGLKNLRGTIAMARTSDPHSASAQFFINVKDNAFLDYPGQDGWGYCVFGKVIEGMDAVDAIESVPTGTHGPFRDVPREPIVIEKAVVEKE